MRELRNLENLFKTGDLIKVEFNHGKYNSLKWSEQGVFQGLANLVGVGPAVAVFPPGPIGGTRLIPIKNIFNIVELVFLPNDSI